MDFRVALCIYALTVYALAGFFPPVLRVHHCGLLAILLAVLLAIFHLSASWSLHPSQPARFILKTHSLGSAIVHSSYLDPTSLPL